MRILSPPWPVLRQDILYHPLVIAAETALGTDSAPEAAAHLFGMVAIEVRPVYLAAYSVGGGEMDNLTFAQGFCRRASVWRTRVPGSCFKAQE